MESAVKVNPEKNQITTPTSNVPQGESSKPYCLAEKALGKDAKENAAWILDGVLSGVSTVGESISKYAIGAREELKRRMSQDERKDTTTIKTEQRDDSDSAPILGEVVKDLERFGERVVYYTNRGITAARRRLSADTSEEVEAQRENPSIDATCTNDGDNPTK